LNITQFSRSLNYSTERQKQICRGWWRTTGHGYWKMDDKKGRFSQMYPKTTKHDHLLYL